LTGSEGIRGNPEAVAGHGFLPSPTSRKIRLLPRLLTV